MKESVTVTRMYWRLKPEQIADLGGVSVRRLIDDMRANKLACYDPQPVDGDEDHIELLVSYHALLVYRLLNVLPLSPFEWILYLPAVEGFVRDCQGMAAPEAPGVAGEGGYREYLFRAYERIGPVADREGEGAPVRLQHADRLARSFLELRKSLPATLEVLQSNRGVDFGAIADGEPAH
ncbi:MAG: hypothetical protein HUJ27_16755 [Rhodobacteraceae bacterium]|nr:hypothetical protein [Paracoccaceae bacterium]